MDVMNPPRVSRTDQIVNYNIRLETLLERSLEQEQVLKQEVKRLLQVQMSHDLHHSHNQCDGIIAGLRKEVMELSKPRQLPKRQASNYMKPRNRGT